MIKNEILLKEIRLWILTFVFLLILSGITAFPIETEIRFIYNHINWFPQFMHTWLTQVHNGISNTNSNYPFMSYGTDWLAFAHIVIGLAFIGPYLNPVKNIWIIEWAMLSCIGVLPLAFIAGSIRGIPFYHQLIDCSFGIIGIIPLYIVWKKIKTLEKFQNTK
jgi:hypothetical protein